MKRLIASLYSYALQIIRVIFSIQVKVYPASICIQYHSLCVLNPPSRSRLNHGQAIVNPVFIRIKACVQVKVYPVYIPNLVSSFRLHAPLNIPK
jgi:hypothetical protein